MSNRLQFLTIAGSTFAAMSVPLSFSAALAAPAPYLSEPEFREAIASSERNRQVIGAARVDDGAALHFAVNTLNGFETAWSSGVSVVVVLFGSSAMLGLNDDAWHTYDFASLIQSYKNDFITADVSRGNPWSHANPSEHPKADAAVPALIARGVKIFVCNTALGDVSRRLVERGQGGSDGETLRAKLREHVLPGVHVVPAGISAIAIAQEAGYTYFSASLS